MINQIKNLIAQRKQIVNSKSLVLTYAPALTLILMLLVNNILPQSEFSQLINVLLIVLVLVAMLGSWNLLRSMLLTQQKNVIELHQSMKLLDEFFEKSPSIMFVKDLSSAYILANKSFRDFSDDNDNDTNYSSDLPGLSNTNIFPHAAAKVMADQDHQVIEKKQAIEFQAKWPGPNGNQYFDILRFPLLDEAGEIFAIGGIANDRTEQVLARQGLRESQNQFLALVRSAPEAVLIANNNGRIVLANKRAEALFLSKRGELLKMSLVDLLPDIDLPIRVKNKVEADDDCSPHALISMLAMDTEGVAHPVEVAVSTTATETGPTITCLVRDVSDRARLETQLRQSQKMEAIGKLTGGMAHDFSNLLGVIMGNIDLASRKLDTDSPVLKRLNTAYKAAERGAELTKRMLAIARRQPLQPKPTNINTSIIELADILPRTLGPEIEMEYDIKDDIPDVLVDPSGLENVFLNLAINARDAMPSGGKFYITTEVLHLSPTDALAQQEDMHPGSYVQIAITDTGEGMTKETLARAFEPFFTTKERSKGTGLGLAMIYGFAKQSGGHVRIYSELGVGTTIDLFLPVSEVKAQKKASKPKNRDSLYSPANSEKILVVDDETKLLEVTVNYLEEMGFDVLAATDGIQALQILEKNPDIELLLTDIVMPGGINGVELADKIRKGNPGVKVLYMSGFPSGVFTDRSGTRLDAPLITKPYTREKLAAALDELLRVAT